MSRNGLEPHESFLLPSIAPAWRATVGALIIIGAIAFVFQYFGKLYTGSIDLAHHYALVSYIGQHLGLPENVPYLGDMNTYPHYSHALAAIFGNFLSSPLMGLQLVTLLSIYGLWAAIALAMATLPQRHAVIFVVAFGALLALNQLWLHAELFGQEVIHSFLFAELVAQALCVWVYVLMLLMERHGTPALLRYAVCVAALHIAVRTHLLPAIELFGSFGLLVALDVMEAGRPKRLYAALCGGIALMVGCACIVLDPAFNAMRKLSVNNGALPLQLLQNPLALALLATVVILLSLTLAWRWLAGGRGHLGERLLVYKYFACFGAATGILCLLQILLLKWGLGSDYACRKYAFALQTLFFIDLALLICSFVMRRAESSGSASHTSSKNVVANLAPALLIALSMHLSFPSPLAPHGQDLGHLLSIERAVTALHDTEVEAIAGKKNYVVGLAGLPWIDDYLFSISVLATPQDGATRDLITGKGVRYPNEVGYLITTVGAKPWDITTCRQHVYASGLVVVDGSCAIEKYQSAKCWDGFDFSSNSYLPWGAADGFSGPEPTGRWNEGQHSSITCTLGPGSPRPSQVLIYAQGHLPAGPQRMLVSINGGPDQAFVYSKQTPSPVISLPIPNDHSAKLQLAFKFPDARQSSTRDLRVISVFFHKIRFQ
ncbi:MAG: hypothetical protein ACREPQ_00120 [Rhodanobacter sp.]